MSRLFCGAPGMTRTCDLLVRSQTLYPTELRARDHYYNSRVFDSAYRMLMPEYRSIQMTSQMAMMATTM